MPKKPKTVIHTYTLRKISNKYLFFIYNQHVAYKAMGFYITIYIPKKRGGWEGYDTLSL